MEDVAAAGSALPLLAAFLVVVHFATGFPQSSSRIAFGGSIPVGWAVLAMFAGIVFGMVAQYVPHVPCRGKISLENIRDDGFEFNVSDFDASSDTSICQPGAGEVFKALPDGTLAYTATYSGAVGILRRTN